MCVMKNSTHLEVSYGMEVHFLTELYPSQSANGCASPFAGDTVGFVNFEDLDDLGKNLGKTQYRAAGRDNL